MRRGNPLKTDFCEQTVSVNSQTFREKRFATPGTHASPRSMRRATTSSPSPQCRCVPPATVPLPIPAPKVPLPDCCRAMVGITMCATELDHQLDRPRSWRTPRFAVDSTHTHARQVHKTRHKDSSQPSHLGPSHSLLLAAARPTTPITTQPGQTSVTCVQAPANGTRRNRLSSRHSGPKARSSDDW